MEVTVESTAVPGCPKPLHYHQSRRGPLPGPALNLNEGWVNQTFHDMVPKPPKPLCERVSVSVNRQATLVLQRLPPI